MDFLIQYKVKPDLVDAQLAAIKTFTDAIRAEGDAGQRYAAYREEDGVSFTHHAWMADEETFAEGKKQRWEGPPKVTKLAQFATSAQ